MLSDWRTLVEQDVVGGHKVVLVVLVEDQLSQLCISHTLKVHCLSLHDSNNLHVYHITRLFGQLLGQLELQPGMVKHFFGRGTTARVGLQHALD